MTEPVQSRRDNVVPLKPERRPAPGVSLARLPAAMHSLRDKARQQLQGLLRELFDQTDDALFELADQATSNQEQNLYFDSMREVRLRRRGIESDFFQRLDEGFARLLDTRSEGPNRDPHDERVSLEDLSLVQNDDLEELVAAEGMVNKANEQFAEPVQHLSLRMDQLVPVKVYQKNNPLGAEAVCGGFTEATRPVEIDVKAKLVLFKLFDKLVVARLGTLYQALNQQMIDANILPSLRVGAPRRGRAHEPGRTSRPGTEPGRGKVETDPVLHTLRDLLSNGTDSGDRGEGGYPENGAGERELGSDDLVQLLSQAQHSDDTRRETAQPVNGRQLVRSLLSDAHRHKLNQVDEDVINLVSMMFEFILDDRNLADPMKALLGRLQIPLVKVAIADKAFFSKGGHPARRLLNEMAMAALGWQDAGEERRRKDTLYQKIEQIVQCILMDFDSDVGLFDQMWLDFRSWQERERRRSKILEQRTLDAEDGKARSERARAQVDAALARLTRGQALAPVAEQLLRDAWSKVLFIVCLKQGADSDDWHRAIATAEQLVWSATAPMERDNRQKLLELVPELLPRLRAGLESIAYNPYDMTQLFRQLEHLHLSRLRDPSGDTGAGAARVEGVGDQRASEPPAEPAAPAGEFLTAADPYLALVSNLSQGSWFEMQDGSGQAYRCRLAAIIKPRGKYIFVNRSGMKVAEETREGLARALKGGRLRLLDDGMLFDRALEAVIGNLRSARAR